MSKILLVESDAMALSELASALRQQRFQIKTHRDLLDGMRELAWFSAKVMVWAPHPNDPARASKFKKVKNYRKYTPLFVIDDDRSPYGEPHDESTFVYSTQEPVANIVQQILSITGVPTAALQYEDDEERETIEENA